MRPCEAKMRKKSTTESFFQAKYGKKSTEAPKGERKGRDQAPGNEGRTYGKRDGNFKKQDRPGRKGAGEGFRKDRQGGTFKREEGRGRPYGEGREKTDRRPAEGFRPRTGDTDNNERSGKSEGFSLERPGGAFKREGGGGRPPRDGQDRSGGRTERSFRPRSGESDYNNDRAHKSGGSSRPERGGGKSRERSFGGNKEERTWKSRGEDGDRKEGRPEWKPRGDKKEGGFEPRRSFNKDAGERKPFRERKDEDKRRYRDGDDERDAKPRTYRKRYEEEEEEPVVEEQMPLNKFIAHGGLCGRREAAELVRQGKVKVNGELIVEPGHKIQPGDKVTVAGKPVTSKKNLVYMLLNKPKGFITTTDDEKGRKTVMDLVASSGYERVYPVGRLDRNTTGLLLMTNDGALAQKLSHPRYNIKKIYHVSLDKPLTKAHFEAILAGVKLDDGVAPVDALAYLEEKHELGLEIHSGRNRIVRRIFESLGYVVEKLDRVMYAGLTKKNLPRGKWRMLTERELILLQHFKS